MSVKIPRVRRKKTSIWIDEDLWDDFIGWCKARGTSTCHLLEPIVYAIMKGSAEAPPFSPLPKIDMTLNLTREVQRYRRREKVGPGPVLDELGTHLHCYFCKRESKWVVYYSVNFDRTSRVYCCGYHVRRYKRMISKSKEYPKVSFQRLYM